MASLIDSRQKNIFDFTAIKLFQPVYNIMEKELQKKSLDRFFRNEYQKLVNFVRKNLDDRYDEASPEDIIQDVALGLIDKLDLDTQISNLTGYIYRSLKNRIIDSRKKKQRTVSIENFTDRKNENYLLLVWPSLAGFFSEACIMEVPTTKEGTISDRGSTGLT